MGFVLTVANGHQFIATEMINGPGIISIHKETHMKNKNKSDRHR